MLKVNLASRPFYNERIVTVILGVIAVIALGLTAFNAVELTSLSSSRTALETQIARDESSKGTSEAATRTAQQSVDTSALGALAVETGEANALIAERTFSWTTFMGLIEKTMPDNVRLVSVAPRVDAGQMWITMMIIARNAEDKGAFMDALEGTGAFFDVQPRDEDITDDGMRRATLRMRYVEPPPAVTSVASTAKVPAATAAVSPDAKKAATAPATAATTAKGKGGRQ